MVNSFDELSKKLALGISRRDMLKVAVAGILGTILSPLGNGLALAEEDNLAPDAWPRKACRGRSWLSKCNPALNPPYCCYCYKKHNRNRMICGVTGHCDIPCVNGKCPGGYFCADTACGTWCVKKCSPDAVCDSAIEELRAKHLGLTTAG